MVQTQEICGSGSVVEHLLAKEKVAGSIPVSRSLFFVHPVATSPSGKAGLCKSPTSGSNPLVASTVEDVILFNHVFFLAKVFPLCDSSEVIPPKPLFSNAPILERRIASSRSLLRHAANIPSLPKERAAR